MRREWEMTVKVTLPGALAGGRKARRSIIAEALVHARNLDALF